MNASKRCGAGNTWEFHDAALFNFLMHIQNVRRAGFSVGGLIGISPALPRRIEGRCFRLGVDLHLYRVAAKLTIS
jgi:hypothetical protein